MNPTTLDAAELREVFLAAAEPNAVRALALTVSLVLVAVVLWLVRGADSEKSTRPSGWASR